MRARYLLTEVTIRGIPLRELILPPWRRYVVDSPLPREIVVRELKKSVAPKRRFNRIGRSEPFEGTVTSEGFKIQREGTSRIFRVRKGPDVIITGTFASSPYGTRVAIVVRPSLVDAVALSFAAIAIMVVGIAIAAQGLRRDITAFAAEPLMLAALGYLYLIASTSVAFQFRRMKPALAAILKDPGERSSSSVTTP